MKKYMFVLAFTFVFNNINSQITNIPINSFMGIKFMSYKPDVEKELISKYGENSVYSNDGNIKVFNIEYGGFSFYVMRLSFWRNKILANIMLQQNYKISNLKYAKETFNELFSTLSSKYGSSNNLDSKSKNEFFRKWEDENGNFISLSLTKSISKGGSILYYVELGYYDNFYTNQITNDF